MKKIKSMLITAICFMIFFTAIISYQPAQAKAATSKALNQEQIEQTLAQAIKEKKRTVTFTASGNYTTTQIQSALNRAAISQNRMLTGSVRFRKQTNGASPNAKYTIELAEDAFIKIKRLNSEAAAVKAAAKALKDRKYATNYYSEKSYYSIFVKMLQQHPEYNYNTLVWRNTNGTYGYHRGSSISKKEQDKKIKAADKAAKDAVKKCIGSGMNAERKAKAIHDYLIQTCSYNEQVAAAGNRYDDAFTAYGALVDGSAVCQGYAAAFNLMAKKCGLQSMAVCGRAGGVAHAWNYVKIGDKNRYVDCTWDDTDQNKKISYQYFNVTEEKMREQHVWTAADFPAQDIKYSKYF